jgi:hypothetical protein
MPGCLPRQDLVGGGVEHGDLDDVAVQVGGVVSRMTAAPGSRIARAHRSARPGLAQRPR